MLFVVSGYVYLTAGTHGVQRCQMLFGPGVIDDCELSNLGAWNQTQDLCKDSMLL